MPSVASQLSAPLTCLTAGGLGVVFAGLQLRTGLHRKNNGISFGFKGSNNEEDVALTAKSRAGGNMQEYVPTGLILLLLLETATEAPRGAVAAYAAVLGASRLIHAFALATYGHPKVPHTPLRVTGFLATIASLVAAGGYLAVNAVRSLHRNGRK